MKVCKVEGCCEAAKIKEMCLLHYKRTWLNGSPFVGRPCLHRPVEEKFWFYVKKGDNGECWEWTGFRDKDGYGKLRTGKTNTAAHRISWQMHNRRVPKGKLVLHRCNNPSCVNPHHLYIGTQVHNMRDRKLAGNCPTGENHHNCKISDAVVAEIRETPGTYNQLAELFGISASQVGNIKRGDQRT
jgi:hypothetical protein